jgi:hypothetical protein
MNVTPCISTDTKVSEKLSVVGEELPLTSNRVQLYKTIMHYITYKSNRKLQNFFIHKIHIIIIIIGSSTLCGSWPPHNKPKFLIVIYLTYVPMSLSINTEYMVPTFGAVTMQSLCKF